MSSREAKRCKRIEEVVSSRDNISSLPNDLLIRILLLVSTKDAVATMILSKRWRFIWTMVPKLEYKDTGDECKSVWRFLDKLLELHKAPLLETLCIQLVKKRPTDADVVGKLVANAVDRFVRKLELELLWTAEPTSLPKSVYTCKTLVELTLSNKILVDVPSSVCLPSLNILRLLFVVFKDEDSLEKLLSCCSVLARSKVIFCISDRINLMMMGNLFPYDKPHIFVACNVDDKFLRSISLATHLYLPLKDLMALDFSGITFSRLVSFMLRPLGHLWVDLLQLVLNNSPKLRFLSIICGNGYRPGYLPLSWYQPSFVARCLSSHLEFVKWKGYKGNEEEKQLMRYILANSKCLKKVSIILTSTFNLEDKEMTEKELKSMPRVSTTSELMFK